MFVKLLVVLSCAAVATYGAPQYNNQYDVSLDPYHKYNGYQSQNAYKPNDHQARDAQYEFGYEVNDQTTGDVKSHQESRKDGVVTGRYEVLDPDGYKRIVEYTADAVHGFNARVRRIPIADYHAPRPTAFVNNVPVYSTVAPAIHAATYRPTVAPFHTGQDSTVAPFPTGYGSTAAPIHTGHGSTAAPFHTGYGSTVAPFHTGYGSTAAPIHTGHGSTAAPFHTGHGSTVATTVAPFVTTSAPSYAQSVGHQVPHSSVYIATHSAPSVDLQAPAYPYNPTGHGYNIPPSAFAYDRQYYQ